MKNPGPVAIVGAGISGLSCARALQEAGVEVRVFERAPRVGGRCATRLWQGHLVDTGVQYFTAESDEFKRELLTRLRQFRPIIPPIYDETYKVMPPLKGPRFYILQGNNYLAQVFSRGLDITLDTHVDTVSFRKDGIECRGGLYRAVISALPAPQTAQLFALGESPAEYTCRLCALLEYTGLDVEEVHNCYARVLPDDSEPIIASYCENHKSGRIIGDKTVFVVQAGPRFSLAYADAPRENYVPLLIRAHEDLWPMATGRCTASFGQRWLLCHPEEASRQSVELPPGAFICGDSISDSTVEKVWLDGRRAAKEVLAFLES